MQSAHQQEKQLNNSTDLIGLSRTLLRIVAQLEETQYTEASSTQNGRQAEVVEHNDLSDPASEKSTSQG